MPCRPNAKLLDCKTPPPSLDPESCRVHGRKAGGCPAAEGSNGGTATELAGSGTVETYPDNVLSRATRIIKGWIPASKFTSKGVLTYENGSTSQVKFYDYTPVLYAYSNYSTEQDLWYVGRVNEYIGRLVYTDG